MRDEVYNFAMDAQLLHIYKAVYAKPPQQLLDSHGTLKVFVS